jgi:hypothetical protein
VGLFGTGKKPAPKAKPMVAAGMRIDSKSGSVVRALASSRQEWQSDAWGYRDKVPELRFGLQFRSRAVARVMFFPAEVQQDTDEPLSLSADKGLTIPKQYRTIAEEQLNRLPLSSGYRFLGMLDENFGVTGEAWLHGYMKDGEEQWDVRSVDEVRPGSDGRMSIRPYGTASYRNVNLDNEELLRMWVPHPRYQLLADSPMISLLDTCEEVVLAGQEMRSASRSRVAANGILLVPDSLTMLTSLKADPTLVNDEAFMTELVAALLAPINNEGDPGQVAPAIIQGPPDALKEFRHVTLERATDPDLINRRENGLMRLGRGMDIPPEILSGLGSSNHWSAWQIDASTYRYHIDPSVRILAESLTEGYLRPALIASGVPREIAQKIQVWYDAGNITENPNRGQDAKDAFERGAIGFGPLRQALGFDESDAPSDDEVLRMISMKIGIDTHTSALLLAKLYGEEVIEVAPPAPAPNQVPQQEPPRQIAQPGETPPDDGTPSTGANRLIKALLAATAQPEADWVVDDDAGRKLMEIDRALREQILAAAEAAMERALEKAGARVKSKAQKNKALAAQLVNVPAIEVLEHCTRTELLALGLNEQELLSDAFAGLEKKFMAWTEAALAQVIAVVLSMLRVRPDSKRGERITERLRAAVQSRKGSGWALLLAALNRLAERRLYDPTPTSDVGETRAEANVPLGIVRGALAHVGGTGVDTGEADPDGDAADPARPVGGIGLGQEVDDVLAEEGAQRLGFEWVYGVTPRNIFPPHFDLDGERFSGWTDPKLVPSAQYGWVGSVYRPGDHRGCACDTIPVYAIREYAEVMHDRLAEETPGMRDVRRLAEDDDAAGRTGTSAQLTRDERDRIVALRKRFIEQGAR